MIKYIVIEWIHGSGKSTIAQKLTELLIQKNFPAKYIHFPNEKDKLWQHIRETLTNKELYKHREIIWLLYAAASNSFHIRTKNDPYLYILERDSVTTWLIFQKEIPRNIRTEIYKFWIQNLKKQGTVIYIDIDRDIALQRTIKRNKELNNKQQVRKDKANDQFIQKFNKLSEEYEKNLLPQIKKLEINSHKITNNTTIKNTLNKIITYLDQENLIN